MNKVYIVKSILICESWYCVENTLGVFATKEEAEKFVNHCSTIKKPNNDDFGYLIEEWQMGQIDDNYKDHILARH